MYLIPYNKIKDSDRKLIFLTEGREGHDGGDEIDSFDEEENLSCRGRGWFQPSLERGGEDYRMKTWDEWREKKRNKSLIQNLISHSNWHFL